ncbi:hypothetical protein QTP86_016910, partial [Hemibagrus guttatus]
TRGSHQLPEGLLDPLPVPRRPWSHISIDFLTDIPNSGGFTAVMVIIDRFSKACKLVPIKELPTALQTADALFQHVFWNFGLPEDIVSDRGPQFTSRVWRAFCEQLGISISLSSSYHPQSNGQAKCLNQEIGWFLRAYCSRDHQQWSDFLPWAEYTQNSLTHSSTGLTPFQCMLGYQPPLFPWTGEPSNVAVVADWFRSSRDVWEQTQVHLQRAIRWQLCPKFIGPFKILHQVNLDSYRVQLLASYRICPTFHASLLKPASTRAGDAAASTPITPPPPLDIDGSLTYRCERKCVSDFALPCAPSPMK